MSAEFERSLCDIKNPYCYSAWCCSCCLVSQLAPRKGQAMSSPSENVKDNPNEPYCCLQAGSFLGFCALPWVLPFLIRQNVRKERGMPDACCRDLITTACCCPCSLAQTAAAAVDADAMPASPPAQAVRLVSEQPQQLRW